MTRLLLLMTLLALAMPGSPANAGDNRGFIHGTVTLQSGEQHTGFLRWDAEEAFWDDLFNSRQTQLPWLDYVDMNELMAERRREYFATHGMLDRLMWTLHNKGDEVRLSRLFISKFGDLEAIEIDEDENITLVIRDGARVPVRGYANDVSSDIIVYPADGEPVELEWDDLANIAFSQAPEQAAPYAERLYGTVETTEGGFEGFIQWDQSECTSTDILDGDKQEIPMGDLRTLTKNRRGSSDIVLRNGESFTMTGTNDVEGGNRGVMVENPDFGRVTIPWNRFQSINFADGMGSGPGRDDFPPITPLFGTVTGTEGESWTGRLVYDLDEAWSHDIFNGVSRDLEFDIPFALINSIEKREEGACRLSLASGLELELGDSQDTGDEHAGVLVFSDGNDIPAYIPWSRVSFITFAH